MQSSLATFSPGDARRHQTTNCLRDLMPITEDTRQRVKDSGHCTRHRNADSFSASVWELDPASSVSVRSITGLSDPLSEIIYFLFR